MSETAPTTPTKEASGKRVNNRLSRLSQYSSTPSLNDNAVHHIGFDCDTRHLFKDSRCSGKDNRAVIVNSADEVPRNDVYDNSTSRHDRVFYKFYKNFSWKFLRKSADDADVNVESASNGYERLMEDSAKKHRFGPLSWRSSKERKKKDVTCNGLTDTTDCAEKINVEKTQCIKQDCQAASIRRTLSDLNDYRDVIKFKTCDAVPSKYKPPVPVIRRNKHELRRSVSQPALSNYKFTTTLEKKVHVTRVAHSEDEGGIFSEDDIDFGSDTGSSIPSRRTSLERGINEDIIIFAEALWDHVAIEPEELPFQAGDVVEVYSALDRDWWWGTCHGRSGWFPADFVRLRVSQQGVSDHLNNYVAGTDLSSSPRLNNDQIRSKIICELINTERDFVKMLNDISEVYIQECKKNQELFTTDQILTIFGNWEELQSFQIMFLRSIEESVDWEVPYKSCVGKTFLKYREEFCMYSTYCNNHSLSIATLQQLYKNSNYSAFFEKCRIKGDLIAISLDGFLLTPVQRICKYPLQLAELLKYTEPEHADYNDVELASEAMRNVAMLINERKRRMESLEKLVLWQQRVEGWEDDDLITHSSQLIHQNEVTKLVGIGVTNASLFLFDHQLICCKKDTVRKGRYVYKGRILLDNSEIVDVPDGKDIILGVSIRNGIRVENIKQHKWLMFCCRTRKEKHEWMNAFERERKLVSQDQLDNLQISETDKRLATITAASNAHRHTFHKHKNKKARRTTKRNHRSGRMTSHSYALGRKMSTWFMFGVGKKSYNDIRIEKLSLVS